MNLSASIQKIQSARSARGFTLIEGLVALAIFAVIAILSYRTLASIFETRERLQQQSSSLRDQALFFARLENDLNALLPRAITNSVNQSEPALRILAAARNADEPVITFTRTGFAAASGASAAPQRIGYRLKDNTIELLIWPGLDQAPRAEPSVYPALKHIREFRWRVLPPPPTTGQVANWQLDWQPNSGSSAIVFPSALELTVTAITGASIVRIFSLRNLAGANGAG